MTGAGVQSANLRHGLPLVLDRIVSGTVTQVRRRATGLDPETAQRLYHRYFHEDVERTERVTGFDLATWKR